MPPLNMIKKTEVIILHQSGPWVYGWLYMDPTYMVRQWYSWKDPTICAGF